jgi:hypothetical protein
MARAHVEGRAVDLAQVRPELGHATNAVCIVGRRQRTRGLYLDRRAFLVSYDPDSDPVGDVLTRTLAAVGPVASGINLAYYFSAVDRLRFGCNTKLPHNIAGLVGVMDGHASDLRTGLPWQTVEIHEPMRLLLVIDAPAERILAAAERLPGVKQLFTNAWVQLAVWNDAGDLEVFDGSVFRPHKRSRSRLPIVDRSIAWFSGKRGHVPPAQVLAAATPTRRRPGRAAAARPGGCWCFVMMTTVTTMKPTSLRVPLRRSEPTRPKMPGRKRTWQTSDPRGSSNRRGVPRTHRDRR